MATQKGTQTKVVSTKRTKLKSTQNNGRKRLLLLMVIFGVIGLVFLIRSYAATKSVPANSRFYWQLNGTVKENVLDTHSGNKVYDIDLFDVDQAAMNRIKAKGITLVCYFSAGSYEDWRPDKDSFVRGTDYKDPLPEWDGEYIINTQSVNARNIMKARLDLAVSKGCDGVEPDNVDGHQYSGAGLTEAMQLDYLQFLATEAHNRNLSIALKNVPEFVNRNLPGGGKVVDTFDFAVVEQCYQYGECDSFKPFADRGKAVFIVEYSKNPNCTDAASKNFDAYKANLALNGSTWTACRTSGGTTPPVNQAPTATVSASTSSAPAPASLAITGTGTDLDGSITKVEIIQNGVVVKTCTGAGACVHNASGLTAGNYSFAVRAYDNASPPLSGLSTTANVTVTTPTPPANRPPQVTIDLPTDGLVFTAPANTTFSATATDPDGDAVSVAFYRGETLVADDSSVPFSTSLNDLASGSYLLRVVATDSRGASATVTRTITVNPTPPSEGGGPTPRTSSY